MIQPVRITPFDPLIVQFVELKEMLLGSFGLSNDAMHVHVGLVLYPGKALVQLLAGLAIAGALLAGQDAGAQVGFTDGADLAGSGIDAPLQLGPAGFGGQVQVAVGNAGGALFGRLCGCGNRCDGERGSGQRKNDFVSHFPLSFLKMAVPEVLLAGAGGGFPGQLRRSHWDSVGCGARSGIGGMAASGAQGSTCCARRTA